MLTTAEAITAFWKEGMRFATPASLVYERVGTLKQRYGVCSPRAFVDAARPENDPLHDMLEWDDSVAGEAHRRHQARQIINSLRIVTAEGCEAPALVHVRIVADGGGLEGYVPTTELRDDAEMLDFALMEARRYFEGGRRRFGHLKELARTWAALDEDLRAIDDEAA